MDAAPEELTGRISLRMSLPHAARVKYNSSWLFRNRALTKRHSVACGPWTPDEPDAVTENDLIIPTAADEYGYVAEVQDAMRAAEIMATTGYGGPVELQQGGTGSTVVLNHSGTGTQTTLQTEVGGEPVQTPLSGDPVNTYQTTTTVTDQSTTQPDQQPFLGSGLHTEYSIPLSLRSAVVNTAPNATLPPLPDPAGADIRATINYIILDADGRREAYPSQQFDLKAN